QSMEIAGRANRYIQDTAAWELKKAGKDAALDTVLASLARTVARLAVLAHPFVPTTSETIWGLFGPPAPLAQVRLAHLSDLDVGGRAVAKPPILFPKPRLAPAGGHGAGDVAHVRLSAYAVHASRGDPYVCAVTGHPARALSRLSLLP